MNGNSKNGEQCVPIGALATLDEGEQMTPPEVGDKVSYTVEGKVTRIVGDQAYVQPESVNGEPVDQAQDKPEASPEEQESQDFAKLQEEAGQVGPMS